MRLALFATCLVSLISFGVRGAFGLFMDPVPRALGLDREIYSFAMALQNLCWGIGQPFAGALLGRFGGARVLAGGVLLYALGAALSAFATTPLAIYASAGVLAGFGLSCASYITALAVLATVVPAERRAWAISVGTAAGSVGQFVLPPLCQSFMNVFGWQATLFLMAGLLLATLVLLPGLRRTEGTAPAAALDLPALDVVRMALSHRSYVLLVLGFFTCGFQLAFIQFHLPAYLTGLGYTTTFAAWSIGLIGLFNIAGSYIAGPVGSRLGYKYFLAAMYTGRTLLLLVLIAFHGTPLAVLLVAAGLGVLWLAAAPTTSGLVMTMFGVRYMPVLFGVTFFSHQIGSFAGVWMGGLVYSHTGSYAISWICCAVLGLVAAALHLPIKEALAPAVHRGAMPQPAG